MVGSVIGVTGLNALQTVAMGLNHVKEHALVQYRKEKERTVQNLEILQRSWNAKSKNALVNNKVI